MLYFKCSVIVIYFYSVDETAFYLIHASIQQSGMYVYIMLAGWICINMIILFYDVLIQQSKLFKTLAIHNRWHGFV